MDDEFWSVIGENGDGELGKVQLGNWEIVVNWGNVIGKLGKFVSMTEKELKVRTRRFAVEILNFVDDLPNRRSSNIIATQLGRCASSVASNYRAACRGRSHAEFISKIGIVEEEADESWNLGKVQLGNWQIDFR
jgi:23S rRNA-intervening sequence protein